MRSLETATSRPSALAGATGTGLTLTAGLTIAHAAGARVYGTDPAGDMTRVFGVGSPEWNEGRDSQLASSGTAARALAQTDFVGYAIHCAQGAAPCQGNPHARPDDATIVPGSNDGYLGLFGAKYVDPAITGGQPCVKAIDGTDIADPFGQCGFPGFDAALCEELARHGRGDAGARHPGHVRLHLGRARQPHARARVRARARRTTSSSWPTTTRRSRRSSTG